MSFNTAFGTKPITLFSEPPFGDLELNRNSCGIVTSDRDIFLVEDRIFLFCSPYFKDLLRTTHHGLWNVESNAEVAYTFEVQQVDYVTTFPFWKVEEDTLTFSAFFYLLNLKELPPILDLDTSSTLKGLSMMFKYQMQVARDWIFTETLTNLVNSPLFEDKIKVFIFICQNLIDLHELPFPEDAMLNSAKNLLLTIPLDDLCRFAAYDAKCMGLPLADLKTEIQSLHHGVMNYIPVPTFRLSGKYRCAYDSLEHPIFRQDVLAVFGHLKEEKKLSTTLRYGIKNQDIIEALEWNTVFCRGCREHRCDRMIEAFREEIQMELELVGGAVHLERTCVILLSPRELPRVLADTPLVFG